MYWFCLSYRPRRYILGVVNGLRVVDRFAKIWKPRGNFWNWITCYDETGQSETLRGAMIAAEISLYESQL